MPVIGEYRGIKFKMYFEQEEHNPPHVHAFYAEQNAVIYIKDIDNSFGNMKEPKLREAKIWVEEHSEELMRIWKTQCFTK